jgi:diguanylate cyclase (GGDEF)-like protein
VELASARVLIAEPPGAGRERHADLLAAGGMAVHRAPDGRIALDLCRIIRPEVLVVDATLPEINGLAVLGRVRSDVTIDTTGVVVIVEDEVELAVPAEVDAGRTYFVSRSARPADLLAAVLRALKDKAVLDRVPSAEDGGRLPARMIDAVTGLPNRRASHDVLAAAARDARRTREPMAIALIGLDDLRTISDRYGLAAGDQVMRALGGRLTDRARMIDTVGRWGREEFIAVFPSASRLEAAAAAEELREASSVQAVSVGEDRRIPVTVSVGWACSEIASPERLLKQADNALIEAKAVRNHVAPRLRAAYAA